MIKFFVQLIAYPLLLGILSAAMALFVGCAVLQYYQPLVPDTSVLAKEQSQIPLRIYASDGSLMAQYGTARRKPILLNEVPLIMRQAFIAIEDQRFYKHMGVDVLGMARAALRLVQRGKATEGASTITMQLARNAFLTPERSINRKIIEILLAFRLERQFSKDEILERYLNKIYLGKGANGVKAAAEVYYSVEHLDQLTLAQTAMIAGLPKAPTRYNPINRPERAKIRRDYILERMEALGFIGSEQRKDAQAEPLSAKVVREAVETRANYVAEMVRKELVDEYQEAAYTKGLSVYTTIDPIQQKAALAALRKALLRYDQRHGYLGPEARINLSEVKTQAERLAALGERPAIALLHPVLVLESDAKTATILFLTGETASIGLSSMTWAKPYIDVDNTGRRPRRVNTVLKAGDIVRVRESMPHEEGVQWVLSQLPRIGGALVLINPDDGAIKALAGGFDYQYSKFNRVVQARRQPGSSFKPFVYAAAISRGYSPDSVVNDAPINAPDSEWSPQNYGGEYIGPTTLAEALQRSRNLVSIRLLREIGVPFAIRFAQRFGFARADLPPNLTLALGTTITTPLEMAGAYAAFANGGFAVQPYFIKKITQNDGTELFSSESHMKVCRKACSEKPKGTVSPRIIDSKTHLSVLGMLSVVTQSGTAAHAGRVLRRRDIAGKTGTTNDQRDSWFAGFTPKHVAVAWAGFDDMSELGDKETSTKIAVPMWTDFMKSLLKDVPAMKWKVPNSFAEVDAIYQSDEPDLVLQQDEEAEPEVGFEYASPQQNSSTPNNNAQAESASTTQPEEPVNEAVEIPEQIF